MTFSLLARCSETGAFGVDVTSFPASSSTAARCAFARSIRAAPRRAGWKPAARPDRCARPAR